MKKEDKISKKRKEREKSSYIKVLRRRDAIRRERKAEEQKNLKEAQFAPKKDPIINIKKNNPNDVKADENIREQLIKNQQILKALEEEYDKEKKSREDINCSLQSDGHESLQDKLQAIHKSVVESQGLEKNADIPPVVDLTSTSKK